MVELILISTIAVELNQSDVRVNNDIDTLYKDNPCDANGFCPEWPTPAGNPCEYSFCFEYKPRNDVEGVQGLPNMDVIQEYKEPKWHWKTRIKSH
ncbi:hypothetical protein L1D14_26510 [Vibrio tubiashii]|uniref:hypothetical protein n=1 Tax=Vibrio tubiashii TaxID=29498 RepID=UPI001EFE639C|nr:hypothetical protein [Vibrio tubiashii]MCG9579760.1 hypothetical protein [Vibrio tubiashii]